MDNKVNKEISKSEKAILLRQKAERLPEIKFSHSMCPDCIKKWYPDFKDGK